MVYSNGGTLMNYTNLIKLVVGAVVTLLLTVGVMIPIIESTSGSGGSGEGFDNGQSEGMKFTHYPAGNIPDCQYSFAMDEDGWVLESDGESWSGELVPTLLFATDYANASLGEYVELDVVIGEEFFYGQSTEMVWSIINGDLYIDSELIHTPEFALLPDKNGNIGQYSRSAHLGDDGFTIAITSWGMWWNGSESILDPEYEGYVIHFDKSDGKLTDVYWTPAPYDYSYTMVERDSLVEVADEILTGDVALYSDFGTETGGRANVTLYSDNTYRLNYFTSDSTSYSIEQCRYNGETYVCKIVGDGVGSIYRNLSYVITANVVPSSVQIVNDKAFYGASDLQSFTSNGNLLAIIGDSAFEGCTSLRPADEIKAKWIGDRAFYGTPISEKLEIADLIHIGDSAFEGCTSLQTVNLSLSNINYIGDRAFYGCSNATVSFPFSFEGNYIEWYGDSAFEYTSVFSPTFYTQTAHIGDRVFANTDAEYIDNLSFAEWGSDVFANSTLVEVYNYTYTDLTTENIGVDALIISPCKAFLFTAPISGFGGSGGSDGGIAIELVSLLPLFVILGLAIGIAIECVRARP